MNELIEIAILSGAIAWPVTVLLFSCAEVARALTTPERH
jgi:hypothetical protein